MASAIPKPELALAMVSDVITPNLRNATSATILLVMVESFFLMEDIIQIIYDENQNYHLRRFDGVIFTADDKVLITKWYKEQVLATPPINKVKIPQDYFSPQCELVAKFMAQIIAQNEPEKAFVWDRKHMHGMCCLFQKAVTDIGHMLAKENCKSRLQKIKWANWKKQMISNLVSIIEFAMLSDTDFDNVMNTLDRLYQDIAVIIRPLLTRVVHFGSIHFHTMQEIYDQK
jgi:hypothetical protein